MRHMPAAVLGESEARASVARPPVWTLSSPCQLARYSLAATITAALVAYQPCCLQVSVDVTALLLNVGAACLLSKDRAVRHNR